MPDNTILLKDFAEVMVNENSLSLIKICFLYHLVTGLKIKTNHGVRMVCLSFMKNFPYGLIASWSTFFFVLDILWSGGSFLTTATAGCYIGKTRIPWRKEKVWKRASKGRKRNAYIKFSLYHLCNVKCKIFLLFKLYTHLCTWY